LFDLVAAVIPEFHCTDEYIEKTYYYRHYVLRKNLSVPDTGHLKPSVFYKGKQGGYARLITASASLILDECRWWRDPRYGYGYNIQKNFYANTFAHRFSVLLKIFCAFLCPNKGIVNAETPEGDSRQQQRQPGGGEVERAGTGVTGEHIGRQ